MLKNYLKIALRNLIKNKTYSLINIIGFAIGISTCLVILLYIQNELSYDKSFRNSSHIYRINSNFSGEGYEAGSPYSLGPELKDEIPGVKQYTRIYNFWGPAVVNCSGKIYEEKNILYADSTVFKLFNYKFIKGNLNTALQKPHSIVITEAIAHKYFGKDNPLNKILKLDNKYNLIVTGVIENVPSNSHIQFDLLAFEPDRLKDTFGSMINKWNSVDVNNYILLSKNLSPNELDKKFPDIIDQHLGKGASSKLKFSLQPLTDIHLYSSNIKWGIGQNGNITTIYIFAAIAFLIFIIACFNYMNLASVQFIKRTKEVGIRKIVGANRSQIFRQLMVESITLLLIAVIISLFLNDFILPLFNHIMDKKLSFYIYDNLPITIIIAFVILIIAIISASYPAIFLINKQPIQILREQINKGPRKILFRRSFVLIQFVITIALIICTLIIYSQLHYINKKNLGFKKGQLIVVKNLIYNEKTFPALRNELLKNPDIIGVSSASSVPPNSYHFTRISTVGEKINKSISSKYFFVDSNFIDLLGFKLIKGRTFSSELSSDKSTSMIVNETAVKELGFVHPIGKKVNLWGNHLTIIGVVKDFNFKSLHEKIEPAFFCTRDGGRFVMAIKIKPANVSADITFIGKKWKEFNPKWPFDYYFVDNAFADLYKSDQKLYEVIGGFSILAIFIACLGLLGLVSYTTEQRTKEIGIRKVVGASNVSIIKLLIKEFLALILISNCVAWPLAYYFINKWLQNFAYRIDISWWMFALSGGIALIIALATVSIQSIKAATANPVKSLRYE